MKLILSLSVFLSFQVAQAATKQACLDGNSSACKEIFKEYGRSSKRDGAVEFFSKVCASEKLKLRCQVTSVLPAETLNRILELHKEPGTALFVINGLSLDKIYQINTVE